MNGVVGATKKSAGIVVFAAFLTRETRGFGAAVAFLGIVDHSNTIFLDQVVEKDIVIPTKAGTQHAILVAYLWRIYKYSAGPWFSPG